MEDNLTQGIVFEHLVELPNCDCVFCSTRDPQSHRVKLFLIFNEQRRIYVRNGSRQTWDELKDGKEYEYVRNGFNQAIIDRKIPCFSMDEMEEEISELIAAI